MNFKNVALSIQMMMLFAGGAAFGQNAHSRVPMVAGAAAPTITILSAATGALLKNYGANNAALDLGRVSFFTGTSGPGQSKRKQGRSFVVSTRFTLKVECPGSSSSVVSVTMSRLDAAPSHAITIDGTRLGSSAQTLAESMPCGSEGEHRLELEVPASTPAGSIGSTVAFVATLRR